MNGLDVLIVVGLVLSAVTGYRRGATLQLFSFGGLLVGLLLGALLAPRFTTLVDSRTAQAGVAVGSLLFFAAVGDTVGWVIGSRVRSRARHARFDRADAAGGTIVAVAAMLLAIWFVALNLANGPFPGVASQVRGSAIVRGLGSALPDPPSAVGEVRKFFDRFGFPEVFEGIPPAPGSPVPPPTRTEAQAAYDAAAASIVKVAGRACEFIQEGSGFVVADTYVVTNAHVVAGVRAPEIADANGAPQHAVTVLFDPILDLAVLHVARPLGPPLTVANEGVERGAVGAVLGYPEGGPLAGTEAAVRQEIEALGHDIYGRGDVERDVYELQASVHPGNSGGPFVLTDGRVAGLVFASSSVDRGVGYALSPSEFQDQMNGALSLTSPVDTGPCIR